jgi:hypothetical protein
MRRTIATLLAAGVLVTVFAGSAAAHVRTTFVTTACVNGSNQIVIRSSWANETIDQSLGLNMTWTLNGKGLSTSDLSDPFVGPYDDPSFAEFAFETLSGPTGPVAWDSWSTIDTLATGAINDTAKTIRQPNGGWPTC